MNTDVFEIISQLIKELLHKDEVINNEKKLINSLQEKGYNLTDINQAFEFIFSSSQVEEEFEAESINDLAANRQEEIGNRVFNLREKFKFNLYVQGIIIKLSALNLITREELEKVIAKSLRARTEVLDTLEFWKLLKGTIDDDFRLSVIATKIPEFKIADAARKETIH